MNRSALEWYELLARGMIWAAMVVLLLSVIGAVVVAGSDSAVPSFEEAERQGRGFFALAALGGGLTSAGLLAGVGAILRVMVAERLAKLPRTEERDEGGTPPLPPISPGERSRRRAEKKPRERVKQEKKQERAKPEEKPRKRAEKKPPPKPPEKDRDEE